ncbi:hypothetical protein [Scytonema sp. NUACC26]|uniref:hypothetical protein n=1 Tax=Scytonema sp. NUACC26 TaxID=3140176 RepID=UPI0038B3E5F1
MKLDNLLKGWQQTRRYYLLPHEESLTGQVRSRRIEQVKQLIEDSFIKRFELSAKILEESVDRLVNALMSSNEWDSIKKALDEYHQRKYNRLLFSVD